MGVILCHTVTPYDADFSGDVTRTPPIALNLPVHTRPTSHPVEHNFGPIHQPS
jgi:hypothetical protein